MKGGAVTTNRATHRELMRHLSRAMMHPDSKLGARMDARGNACNRFT